MSVSRSDLRPHGRMAPSSTAVVLVGFQNDFFAAGGELYGDITDVGAPERVLGATVGLIDRLAATETLIVATPIVFTPSYAELLHPVGILAAVKARGAFRAETDGSLMPENLRVFGTRIVEIGGRRGLNAFSNKVLDESLAARGIVDVVIAGALTCVCVDSTARSAHERGYRVTILSDCTMGTYPLRAALVLRADLPPVRGGEHLRPGCRSAPRREQGVAVIADDDVSGSELQILVQYHLVEALQEHDLAEAQRLARLGSWTWDLGSGVVTWSDELYRIFEVDESTFVPSFESFLSLVHHDDRADVEATTRAALVTHDSFRFECRLERDVSRWVRSLGEVDVAVDGSVTRMHGTVQEISLERAMRVALAERDRLCAALTASAAGRCLTLYEADGRVAFTTGNEPALPLGPGDLQDPQALGFIHEDDVARVRREVARLHMSPGATVETNFRVIDAAGVRDVELRGLNAADDPNIRGTLISHTSGAEAESGIASTPATPDPLTGLASHTTLLDYARRAEARAVRCGWSTAVLVIDVDDFHDINETQGPEVGDEVLVELASRLADTFRVSDVVARAEGPAVDDDVVARLGGDRFVVVCENVSDVGSAGKVVDRVRHLMAEPIVLASGEEVTITVGIGAAIAGPFGRTAEQRIRDAEDALRSAKQAGRDKFEVVGEGAATEHQLRRDAERALQQAFEREEFVLHYQAKVSLESDRVTGAEALLRWQDPTRGLVPPQEFIPLAEASGLIIPIGVWVIEQACAQITEWHRRFPRRPPLVVAVNVSGSQFGPDLIGVVSAVLAATGAAADQLRVEVTESTLISDADGAVETLRELAALGVKISIDDFGTGYSSLAYLKRLPLHELKIDRTFVDGLGDDTDDTAIVGATVALAHALGLSVTAEGVETADQLERLRVIGCQEAQGYFVSRPVPAAAFTALLVVEETSGWRAATATEPEITADAYRPHRVLVVDDTEDVRQLARMALSASGFEVYDTADGTGAVSMAQELRPDCVVLDVSMPGMSGVQVCRALRSDPRTAGCTILMLTGNTAAEQKIEAFRVGADDYIIKPFSPRDLVGRVRSALRVGHTDHPVGPATRPLSSPPSP